MEKIYELLIIGGGPAGAGAAVYASRKKLTTLLVLKEWGGQSIVSAGIENWLGEISIPGMDLANKFKNHVLHYAGNTLTVKENEEVAEIKSAGEKKFEITLKNGEKVFAQTVLIAAGSGRRKLDVPGADRLEHRGITYCASCDGPLFSGKDVVVVGGGNAAFETAAQLLAYTTSVTILNRSEVFKADPITVEKVKANPKTKIILNAQISEVKGENAVSSLVYKDLKDGFEKEISTGGIFVEIGQMPNTQFVKNLLPLDQYGRVQIDPKNQKTAVSGIWAAGDCTDVLYHQNNIAVGDAVRAIEDIYLSLHAK